jgi:tetratricopeptide (TPR) repeat protein
MMHVFAAYAMTVLSATVFDSLFEQANDAYLDDRVTDAINLYEQLVSDGIENPAVFYNLGNAYYRNNQLGPAIANYERSLQLDPNLTSADRNLDICIQQTPRQAGRPLPPDWEQGLLFWHYGFARSATYAAAAVFWTLAWGLLLLRLWRPIPYTRLAAAGAFILAAAFVASGWAKTHPPLLAVVNVEKTPAYYNRDPEGTVHFELLLGDRVTVDARESGWLRVTMPSGERGWAEASQFTLVGPPYERPPMPVELTEPAANASGQQSR